MLHSDPGTILQPNTADWTYRQEERGAGSDLGSHHRSSRRRRRRQSAAPLVLVRAVPQHR